MIPRLGHMQVSYVQTGDWLRADCVMADLPNVDRQIVKKHSYNNAKPSRQYKKTDRITTFASAVGRTVDKEEYSDYRKWI